MIDVDDVTGPMALEDYELQSGEQDAVENVAQGAIRYAFIGSGQGGSRLAAAAYARGYHKTIVLNTAPQDLQHIQVPEDHKLLLDIGTAGGAGKNVLKGEEATTQYQGEILDLMRRIFGRKVDHIMICVGAGGGSGGGSLIPLITIIAKTYLQALGYTDVDQRVGVFLALPRDSEATNKVAFNAVSVAESVSELAEQERISPLIVIDNAKIAALHPRLSAGNLWPPVNDGIMHLFDLFNRLPLHSTQHTSFDPADYETVVRAGGHVVMGVTRVPVASIDAFNAGAETEISKVMRHSIDRTLIADGFDLKRAKAAACVIVASAETLAKLPDAAVEYVYTMLGNITGGVVHRGMYEDSRPDLRIYVIIGGLSRPSKRYERLHAQCAEHYGERS